MCGWRQQAESDMALLQLPIHALQVGVLKTLSRLPAGTKQYPWTGLWSRCIAPANT